MEVETVEGGKSKPTQELGEVALRFVGDSGDGMQLAGSQFTNASAVFGNDVSTLPDFPAEIRAPAGTLFGVSGFQINFSSHDIHTPGDEVDALVAMNPAGLKTNLGDLRPGGILVVDSDEFTKGNLAKARYDSNPLEDGSLSAYRLYKVPITSLTVQATKESGLSAKGQARCKNFFALGLACWLFDRPLEPALNWIQQKFGKTPEVAEGNTRALKAGYYLGETAEMFVARFRVPKARLAPGKYRNITGNEALAVGLITAANLAGKELFYASYPITPASDILHELSRRKNFRVKTFQAEDEIAAMTALIGASFAGDFAVTGTSGPGMALKQEGIGLAVMTELPMVIVNVQRGGPSTGLPTKTEQADLLQAVVGRNSEAPCPVLAAASPADCFHIAIEAFRIAVKYMTPVIVLTDGYLANGAEPWLIPDPETLPKIVVKKPGSTNGQPFRPYARDAVLARPWALPGTPGMEHRVGGLEKENLTGNISYSPENHQAMVELRARKVADIARDIPSLEVFGNPSGDLLLLGWGGTGGAIRSATEELLAEGKNVACAHLRYLYPFPANTGEVLARFNKVLIPELNTGQLRMLIRAHYLVDAVGLNKIQGRPFMVSEITAKVKQILNEVCG